MARASKDQYGSFREYQAKAQVVWLYMLVYTLKRQVKLIVPGNKQFDKSPKLLALTVEKESSPIPLKPKPGKIIYYDLSDTW